MRRPCGCGGYPACLDCRGSGWVRVAEVDDPYEGGHDEMDGADNDY